MVYNCNSPQCNQVHVSCMQCAVGILILQRLSSCVKWSLPLCLEPSSLNLQHLLRAASPWTMTGSARSSTCSPWSVWQIILMGIRTACAGRRAKGTWTAVWTMGWWPRKSGAFQISYWYAFSVTVPDSRQWETVQSWLSGLREGLIGGVSHLGALELFGLKGQAQTWGVWSAPQWELLCTTFVLLGWSYVNKLFYPKILELCE